MSSHVSTSISEIVKRDMSNAAKLLDHMRELLRIKHDALKTAEAYVDWIRQCAPGGGCVSEIWRNRRKETFARFLKAPAVNDTACSFGSIVALI